MKYCRDRVGTALSRIAFALPALTWRAYFALNPDLIQASLLTPSGGFALSAG